MAKNLTRPLLALRPARAGSSVGQSSGLIIRQTKVRVLPGPFVVSAHQMRSDGPNDVRPSADLHIKGGPHGRSGTARQKAVVQSLCMLMVVQPSRPARASACSAPRE